MLIEITADDIREGIRNDCWNCPAAIAMSRAMRQKIAIDGCGWKTEEDTYRIRLPKNVIDWISHFDQGHEVQPISFEIN